MTGKNYAFEGYDKEKMARVIGRDLSISTKQSVEICSYLKGKNIQRAKSILADAMDLKRPIPFKRFTEGAGHKRGKIAGGKYPVKASAELLKLVNSLEANAQQKGIETSNLMIKHACANKASRPPKHGRRRGLESKRSHVEFVAVEGEKKEKREMKEKGEKKESGPKKEKPAAAEGGSEKPAPKEDKGEGKKESVPKEADRPSEPAKKEDTKKEHTNAENSKTGEGHAQDEGKKQENAPKDGAGDKGNNDDEKGNADKGSNKDDGKETDAQKAGNKVEK
ncbi:MAG: 50S ribosomal protein L22 [Candidatus Woesearchaeota archaeon]